MGHAVQIVKQALGKSGPIETARLSLRVENAEPLHRHVGSLLRAVSKSLRGSGVAVVGGTAMLHDNKLQVSLSQRISREKSVSIAAELQKKYKSLGGARAV